MAFGLQTHTDLRCLPDVTAIKAARRNKLSDIVLSAVLRRQKIVNLFRREP
jgi:hypothetical protein